MAWISLNASKALLNIPGGKVSDRFGRWRTQVAGWGLYAAAYALFPMTRSLALTWTLLVAYGAYYGLTEGGEKALVADLAPLEIRGRAYGAMHAVTGLAVLPANGLFGALYTSHVQLAFWVRLGVRLRRGNRARVSRTEVRKVVEDPASSSAGVTRRAHHEELHGRRGSAAFVGRQRDGRDGRAESWCRRRDQVVAPHDDDVPLAQARR